MRALPTQRKALRMGVIHNGTIIEERLFQKRRPVTLGVNFRNTFSVASPNLPNSFSFFELRGNVFVLNFNDSWTGRLLLGQSVHTLESLKQHGRATKKGNVWSIALDEDSRGKIVIGDMIFLFQFVTPPPTKPAAQLPVALQAGPMAFLANSAALTSTFGMALLLSCMLQVGFVAYLVIAVPPPPRMVGVNDIPDEIRIFLTESDPQDDVPIVENEGDNESTEIAQVVEDEVDEVAVESEDEDDDDEPTPARSESAELPDDHDLALSQARERVVVESFFGAVSTSDSGVGPMMDGIFEISDRDTETILSRLSQSGEGDLVSAGAGFGTGDGDEDAELRDEIAIAPPTRLDPPIDIDNNERDIVEVETEIGGTVDEEDERTRGDSDLDPESLRDDLGRYNDHIERCYLRALPSDPDLGGRIVLQFNIENDGRVDSPYLVENEVGSLVGNCVLGRVRRWRFDQHQGDTVTVRKTYILSPDR